MILSVIDLPIIVAVVVKVSNLERIDVPSGNLT